MANNHPIYIFHEHNEAFYFWHKARRDGFLDRPLDLLHVDAHSDMSLPPALARSLYSADGNLEYYRELAYGQIDIASFILPAVLNGLVSNVYFVSPSWRNQQAERRRLHLGSFFGEGKILKHLTAGAVSSPHTRKVFPDLKSFHYAILPIEEIPLGRRVILDIDLDFFACRDSVGNQVAYELEITADQFKAADAFLRDPTLPHSGITFDFHRENGRAFVRVSPKKREEKSYLPTKQQIVSAVESLVNALVAKKIKPALVTVCRSCFSGYTPKEYVAFIEDALKRALLNVAEWHLAIS
jgi:hypothetical protein